MSLKTEERLGGFRIAQPSPKIFTTGAYLVPMKITAGNSRRFVWVVEQFDDDSYYDGELCSPVELAETADKLLHS